MIAYSIICFFVQYATVHAPAQCAYAAFSDHKMKKGWKQGQKLLKKESNVGMLLILVNKGQKQAACRD